MGILDQTSRYLVKRQPAAFFAWLMPKLVQAFMFQGFEDTRTLAFPGEPDRVCDTVGRFAPVKGDAEHRLVDVEFEAEPTADMLERTGEYAYRLRRERRYGADKQAKYRVIPVIVYLTGPVPRWLALSGLYLAITRSASFHRYFSQLGAPVNAKPGPFHQRGVA